MLLQPKKLCQLKDYQKIGQKIEGIYLKIPELDPDITDFVILMPSLPRKLRYRVHSETQESSLKLFRLKKVKQNLLDLGIDYYADVAASRIVDGLADLSIWNLEL